MQFKCWCSAGEQHWYDIRSVSCLHVKVYQIENDEQQAHRRIDARHVRRTPDTMHDWCHSYHESNTKQNYMNSSSAKVLPSLLASVGKMLRISFFFFWENHTSRALQFHFTPPCSSLTHISYHNQNSRRRRRVSNKKIRYLSAQWSTSSCLSLSVCYDNCLSICSTLSWCLFLSLPTLCLPK